MLELMQRHELDFHSTFRKLSSFAPSILSSDSEALATFLQELTPETQACTVPSVRQSVMDDWKKWLKGYTARIESDAVEWASEGDSWMEKRREAMHGANPRFVLRQWVLEEVIKKVEGDWETGRRVLAKVLEVRAHSVSVDVGRITDAAARLRWHVNLSTRGVGKARKRPSWLTRLRRNGGCAG